ncbi:MAG: exonuclease subunit SbcD [Nodosilinea sp. LVE1205-7]
MVKILHLSDIHLGSGLSYGRLNPETGLNTRLEDFIAALGQCIDRALAEPVDGVLFAGDAFPDATPPPFIQQALAQQFCRLSAAQIPTVLLVGNHDQHAQGQGGTSLSIYRTLGVPGVVVGDRLETHRIETRRGSLQVVTLPWLTRSTLLTRPDTEGLSMAQVHGLLLNRLEVALEAEIRGLNPQIPTVLLAHAMVDRATYGAERFLAASRGFTIPMALLARPCFDYVALGHVHRYQVLCQQPLMIYPGSIERVDFSEEKEEKGYLLVEVEPGQAQAEFCPLPVRPFKTLEVDLTAATDPQAAFLAAISAANVRAAVVRCFYHLRPEQRADLDLVAIAVALQEAHSYSLQARLPGPSRDGRWSDLDSDRDADPITALQAYLANRQDLAPLAEAMLKAAKMLIEPEKDREIFKDNLDLTTTCPPLVAADDAEQLRLL